MGGSSRLCAALKPGEPVVLMGPTGTPTEIPQARRCCSRAAASATRCSSRSRGAQGRGQSVIYFAGYRNGDDLFKQDDIEAGTGPGHLVPWTRGRAIAPRAAAGSHFRGNIVQAMVAYAKGELGAQPIPLNEVDRIIAIGSDRMMRAVQGGAPRRAAAVPQAGARGHRLASTRRCSA